MISLTLQRNDSRRSSPANFCSGSYDSPFFSYVNSLSPIKHVNVRSISNDIAVPSPQPVFTSPHMIFPRNMSLILRSQKETLCGPQNFSPGFVGFASNAAAREENIDNQISAPIPSIQLESENEDSFQEHSSSCHTDYATEFLADDDGDSDNPFVSPGSHPRQLSTSLENSVENTHMNAEPKAAKIYSSDKVQNCTHSDFDDTLLTDTKGAISNEFCYLCVKNITDISQGFESQHTFMKEVCMEFDAVKPLKGGGSNVLMDFDPSFQDENNIVGEETPSMDIPLPEDDNRNSDIDLERTYQMQESTSYSVHGCISAGLPSLQASLTQYKQMTVDQNAGSCSFVSKDGDLLTCANDAFAHISKGVKVLPDAYYVQQESFSDEVMEKIPSVDAGIMPSTSNKGVQHHGLRKRLQFQAAEICILKNGGDKKSGDNKIVSTDDEKPLGFPLESGTSHSIYAESVAKPIEMQTSGLVNITGNSSVSYSQHVLKTPEVSRNMVNLPSRISASSLNTVIRPCGIGLHLNSIGNAAPMKCTSRACVSERELTISEKDTVHVSEVSLTKGDFAPCTSINVQHMENLVATSVEPLSFCTAENNKEVLTSSASYQTVIDVKQTNTSDSIDGYATPCLKGPQGSRRLEESNPLSSRKKRKKSIDSGCKNCNCKKSKCLKLYCDCFASGNFCTEDCACRECFNKPEHHNVVSETRQQIELRNPLAFAPRVVVRGVDSHKDIGYIENVTTSSARHKRGCNCKKSLCLKKYCECFQASVGCSLGCRCEDCQNTFGRNDGFQGIGELDRKVSQKDDPTNFGEEELDLASSPGKMDRRHSGGKTASFNRSHLSPLTPSLHGSSESDASKLLSPASYYPSPESLVPVLNSFSDPLSPSNVLLSCGDSEEGREESSSIAFHHRKQDFCVARGVGTLSPCQDGYPDISSLSPLSILSPIPSGTSSSPKGEQKVLQSKLFQVNSCLSNSNPNWRCSPITPFPHFGEGKFVIAPDNGQSDNVYDDDTPDILKEISPLVREVKATSPNKKRVSPPHMHLKETRRRSISPNIKNSRRYILQSVSSFPSLTPYRKTIDDDDDDDT